MKSISILAEQPDTMDATQLKSVKRRFMGINQTRLSRVYDSLNRNQRVFLDILPLLFHANHPVLPGYVSNDTPMGLADYTASKKTLDAAKSLSREFSFQRRAMRIYNIEALYMMGSSGTIAYSEKSDFDIWVCHRPGLSFDAIDELRQKCELITKWADTLGLEANFFVLTADHLLKGKIESLSEESSGSTQHLLLLEEFYRTGLLIGGRYPAWWLIPPGFRGDYREHIQSLVERNLIYEHEVLDFGNLTTIPVNEFFGATLWQLHKAVSSPYKSVMKLLLMESYAGEHPEMDLLCSRFKRAVYEGETNVDNLDPYILMHNKVEEYLTSRNEPERVELARRCFYFKINEKLSETGKPKNQHRREIMSDMVASWGWAIHDIMTLDSRDEWKLDKVLDERKTISSQLTTCYRILSKFAREYASESSISKEDLNLLGRQLYVAFEKKAGKVELINPGISTNLSEKRLSFVRSRDREQNAWALYRHDIETVTRNKLPATKRTNSIIEMAAWCHFNQVIGPRTMTSLHDLQDTMSSRELIAINDSMNRMFPDKMVPRTPMAQYGAASRIVSSALYINLGHDPLLHHTQKGLHLTSDRSDAFSFSGQWFNLVQNCEALLITNWGEILTFRYSGETAVLDCLCDYLSWAPRNETNTPPTPEVFCFSSNHGSIIAKRTRVLFHDLIHTYFANPRGESTRYIMRIGRDYYQLQSNGKSPRYRHLASEHNLLGALAEPQKDFSPILFDRYIAAEIPVATIVKYNRPNVVQLFYQVQEPMAHVFILDERGSLFYQKAEYHNCATLIGQYHRFLDSAINRRNIEEQSATGEHAEIHIEFHKILSNRGGKLQLESKPFVDTPDDHRYFSIQVIVSFSGDDNPSFTLYCNNQEFSSLEFGNEVFYQAANYVLAHRQGEGRYPIYITDVDITSSIMDTENIHNTQTIQFLNYKKTIEQRLNDALMNI